MQIGTNITPAPLIAPNAEYFHIISSQGERKLYAAVSRGGGHMRIDQRPEDNTVLPESPTRTYH